MPYVQLEGLIYTILILMDVNLKCALFYWEPLIYGFHKSMSTIAIPATMDQLSILVDDHWGAFNDIESIDALKYAQKRVTSKSFCRLSLEEILEVIRTKENSGLYR